MASTRAGVALQQIELRRVLEPLLAGVKGVALLDFPNHPNVGDSAIWLGERALLRSFGCSVRYAADLESFRPEACRASLREGDRILLHGGGNLGDLWPRHEQFRERVVASFPDLPIIQLPQTIHFGSQTCLEDARRILNAHPRLTLLVRDHASLRVARENFTAEAHLAPDSAVALGPLPLPARPRVALVWQSRVDLERAEPRPSSGPGQPLPVDWLEEKESLAIRFERRLAQRVAGPDAWPSRFLRGWGILRDHIARTRLDRGCRMLAGGRAVVTNRLHGHLLCLLMGIPHYISDNGYGKLRSYYETWTRASSPDIWCDSEAEALERASRLPAVSDPTSGRIA